jgi:hypothetical protein
MPEMDENLNIFHELYNYFIKDLSFKKFHLIKFYRFKEGSKILFIKKRIKLIKHIIIVLI